MGDGDAAKDEWILAALGFSVRTAGAEAGDASAASSRSEEEEQEHSDHEDEKESGGTLEAEGAAESEGSEEDGSAGTGEALEAKQNEHSGAEAESPDESEASDERPAEQEEQEDSGLEDIKPGQSAPSWKQARQAWQDANDAVNDQINGLRSKLLERAGAGDDGVEGLAEALKEIADAGLNGITEDHRVKLIASVMSIGDGAPAAMQKNGPKALNQIATFLTFLDGSEMIAVCDDNPFGAPVSIKATLSPPLQQMQAALKAATAAH